LVTATSSSNNSLADNFTDEATTADMNGKIFVSHLLQLSLLSPALEGFLNGFSNLYGKARMMVKLHFRECSLCFFALPDKGCVKTFFSSKRNNRQQQAFKLS